MANRGKNSRNTALKLGLLLLVVILFPLHARSQEARMDFSVDYSFLRSYPDGSGAPFNSNGGSASASWNFNRWLSVAGDFGGYKFGSQQPGVTGHLLTYAGGPRISFRGEARRWTPFAQCLVGGASVSGSLSGQSATENGLAILAGGGLDAAFRPRIAFRVVEFDYLLTRFNRVTNTTGFQNDFRVSTGIILHFGRR